MDAASRGPKSLAEPPFGLVRRVGKVCQSQSADEREDSANEGLEVTPFDVVAGVSVHLEDVPFVTNGGTELSVSRRPPGVGEDVTITLPEAEEDMTLTAEREPLVAVGTDSTSRRWTRRRSW